MIEKDFDIPFIADLARHEKQIQQNYRPVIAVHKWFARRPGTLFRGLLLAEFSTGALRDTFYKGASFAGKRVCDPFMGGGTPLLEANRVGCDVIGYDINPMAHWIVHEELDRINLDEYRNAASKLRQELGRNIGALYRTKCLVCGSDQAHAKYFLWVKVQQCTHCMIDVDLFPGYLLSEDTRHPKNLLVCPSCGGLNEVDDVHAPGACSDCGGILSLSGPAKRGRCECPKCRTVLTYPVSTAGPLRHRMFAIEYYCPFCKEGHKGRFFKKPDPQDLEQFSEAESVFSRLEPAFIPSAEIPKGDETNRLHRWGYRFYAEMFNVRQLLGLELSCQIIAKQPVERLRHALATNLSDLLRYQNMLCRYDTMALKSLDIFSVHGFPVGLVQCESNLLGIPNGGEMSVGSGGWANIIDKYAKAKEYCDRPFEVRHDGRKKTKVFIRDEWIGESRQNLFPEESRNIDLRCADASQAALEPESLDAVLTDPPYFGNVQYAELMDFCYVWLRRLTGDGKGSFQQPSTRHADELTGNDNMSRGLDHFTDGLSRVFQRMANALKPSAPLAFTYHHNRLDAYGPLAVAILDAELQCTAAIPCPGEMGASIHISGTSSSTVDTVFVCRKRSQPVDIPTIDSLSDLIGKDEEALAAAGLTITAGDKRCIRFGHITRIVVDRLRSRWDATRPVAVKLEIVSSLLMEHDTLNQPGKPLVAASLEPAAAL